MTELPTGSIDIPIADTILHKDEFGAIRVQLLAPKLRLCEVTLEVGSIVKHEVVFHLWTHDGSAIVEFDDGSIRFINAHNLRFTDQPAANPAAGEEEIDG